MDQAQQVYTMMIATVLGHMTPPRTPAQFRFMRGEDENGSCLMCFGLGPERGDDDEREMTAFVHYDSGAFGGPGQLHPEGRLAAAPLFGLDAAE